MPPAWGRPNRGAKAAKDLTLWADGMSLAVQVQRAGGQNSPVRDYRVNTGCNWQAGAVVWMAAGMCPHPCWCSSTPQGNQLHGWVACCEVRRARMSEQHPAWARNALQTSQLCFCSQSIGHLPPTYQALPRHSKPTARAACLRCRADQNHSPAGQ